MDEQIINEALTHLLFTYNERIRDEKFRDIDWTETKRKIERIEAELKRM